MGFRTDRLENLTYANPDQEQMRANPHLELPAGQLQGYRVHTLSEYPAKEAVYRLEDQ
jgi:hypothetical protein